MNARIWNVSLRRIKGNYFPWGCWEQRRIFERRFFVTPHDSRNHHFGSCWRIERRRKCRGFGHVWLLLQLDASPDLRCHSCARRMNGVVNIESSLALCPKFVASLNAMICFQRYKEQTVPTVLRRFLNQKPKNENGLVGSRNKYSLWQCMLYYRFEHA